MYLAAFYFEEVRAMLSFENLEKMIFDGVDRYNILRLRQQTSTRTVDLSPSIVGHILRQGARRVRQERDRGKTALR